MRVAYKVSTTCLYSSGWWTEVFDDLCFHIIWGPVIILIQPRFYFRHNRQMNCALISKCNIRNIHACSSSGSLMACLSSGSFTSKVRNVENLNEFGVLGSNVLWMTVHCVLLLFSPLYLISLSFGTHPSPSAVSSIIFFQESVIENQMSYSGYKKSWTPSESSQEANLREDLGSCVNHFQSSDLFLFFCFFWWLIWVFW